MRIINIPYKCPVCNGSGEKDSKQCPACHGDGVVWGVTYEESACSPASPPYVPSPTYPFSPNVWPQITFSPYVWHPVTLGSPCPELGSTTSPNFGF